jgi:hypothetical protein
MMTAATLSSPPDWCGALIHAACCREAVSIGVRDRQVVGVCWAADMRSLLLCARCDDALADTHRRGRHDLCLWGCT